METKPIGKVCLTPKDTWDPNTTYDRLDVVEYNGSSYISKKDKNTNNTPGVQANESYWMTLVAQGSPTETQVTNAINAYFQNNNISVSQLLTVQEYSQTTYSVGALVTHTESGATKIYRCKTAIDTGEEWNSGHWEEIYTSAIVDDTLLISGAAADAKKTGDLFASVFSTSAYSIGDYVLHNGKLYRFKAAHGANTNWSSSEVDEISITQELNNKLKNLANVFSSSTSYSTGNYVIYNGQLYVFTTNHAAGAWIGTDVKTVTLGREIEDLADATYSTTLADPMVWDVGGISSSSGSNSTSSTRIRSSGFHRLVEIQRVSCSSDYKFVVFVYSGEAASTYVGIIQPDGSLEKTATWQTSCVIPQSVKDKYFRIVFAYANNAEVTTDIAENINIFCAPDTRLNDRVDNAFYQIGTASSLVNYDYDEPIERQSAHDDSGNDVSSGIIRYKPYVKRDRTHFTISCPEYASGNYRIIINSSVRRCANSNDVANLQSGIHLIEGHRYVIKLTSLNDTRHGINIAVYKLGTSVDITTRLYMSDNVHIRSFVAPADEINIGFFIPQGVVLDNAEFEVIMYDATEERAAEKSIVSDDEESNYVASKKYNIGDYLIVGQTLYKVTATIASGGDIIPDTNVTATTITKQLKLLANL